jgi:hypothetical protein
MMILLEACFYYTGSLSKLNIIFITIFDDVITYILESNKSIIKYFSDENNILEILELNLLKIRNNSISQNLKNNEKNEHEKNEKMKMKNSTAFHLAVISLMKNLSLLFKSNGFLRRMVSQPIEIDWLGVNMLDGPFDDRTTAYTNTIKNNRKNVISPSQIDNIDIDKIIDIFIETSELYDPLSLPRNRIKWLENVCRLHDLKGSKSESAEIRWRIFRVCEMSKSTWSTMWVPRQPLDWKKRGYENVVYTR